MFQRGFKSWCENTALTLRKQMRITKEAPLNPFDLALFLGVQSITPSDIPTLSQSSKELLLGRESSSWSAVTISKDGTYLIVYNPRHSIGRQASNIMHELSHIIRRHKPSHTLYSKDSGFALRQYNKNLEEESDWLAATLLLPKTALIHIKWSGMTYDQACKKYIVSKPLLTMRMNITGVNRMYGRSTKAR